MFNNYSISTFSSITNKCTRSLQFRVINYLVLLVTLLRRHVRHLNHQILLICLSACVVGYSTTFEQGNANAVFNLILGKMLHITNMTFCQHM